MAKTTAILPAETIESQILLIRRHKVMLSSDLAALYGVEPRALVQAVKRNRERFRKDFMFQLSAREFAVLKSQIVISTWGGARRASPMRSPSKAWPCSPACCGASGPCW